MSSLFYIIKYSAMVKMALFLSSSQSPAIKSSSNATIRSPVSKSFGRSCRRKPPAKSSFGGAGLLRGGLFSGLGWGRGGETGAGGGQTGLGGLGAGFAGSGMGRRR